MCVNIIDIKNVNVTKNCQLHTLEYVKYRDTINIYSRKCFEYFSTNHKRNVKLGIHNWAKPDILGLHCSNVEIYITTNIN